MIDPTVDAKEPIENYEDVLTVALYRRDSLRRQIRDIRRLIDYRTKRFGPSDHRAAFMREMLYIKEGSLLGVEDDLSDICEEG